MLINIIHKIVLVQGKFILYLEKVLQMRISKISYLVFNVKLEIKPSYLSTIILYYIKESYHNLIYFHFIKIDYLKL